MSETAIQIFIDESGFKDDNKVEYVILCSIIVKSKRVRMIKQKLIGDLNIKKAHEIHYTEINNAGKEKMKIAKRYCEYLQESTNNNDNLFIFIAVVNKKELKKEFGKGTERERNIEKRFVRLAISYPLKRYIRRYRPLKVERICIDKGSKTEDKFFRIGAIKKIESQSHAQLPKVIEYIDSDPKKETRYPIGSLYIDLVDLILGIFTNSIRSKSADNKNKKELTEQMTPYLNALIKKKVRSGRVGFYPKTHKEEMLNRLDGTKTKKMQYKEPAYAKKIHPKGGQQLSKYCKVSV
ncbi:MAG: DUF3800 domain-containing protein [Candidatus Bilamarchaeaceae archaeon]